MLGTTTDEFSPNKHKQGGAAAPASVFSPDTPELRDFIHRNVAERQDIPLSVGLPSLGCHFALLAGKLVGVLGLQDAEHSDLLL